MSADDLLYDDPALAGFYDLENRWGEDFDLIRAMTRPGLRVLDLGCGTGQLGAGLALAGCIVTGVDPASAMLDIARRRTGGNRVSWREGDARAIRLGRTFDLVVLTGHAFQVFLTDDDRRAVPSVFPGASGTGPSDRRCRPDGRPLAGRLVGRARWTGRARDDSCRPPGTGSRRAVDVTPRTARRRSSGHRARGSIG